MLRRNIIICAHPNKLHTRDRLKLLENHHHVSIVSHRNRQDLMANFRKLTTESPYHAAVFYPGYINAIFGRWDKDFFTAFDKSLKLVIGAGAGYDHVDLEHLTKAGVCYANAPISVSEPAATTAVMLALQTIRATTQAEMSLRKGQWIKGLEPTDDIRDLTIGIVGYGTIGRLVQAKLHALGAKKFLYHDRHRVPPRDENGATYSSMDELLSKSNLVTLHCPLTPETRHLLSDKQFAMMKHGSYIVNTSRGPVINEGALVRAMKSGRIARVGLDVFEHEPEVHSYLMTSERATLLPHWGSKVKRVFHDIEHECLDNLDSWLETGVPKTPVNKEVHLGD
ncbi:glycerate dehydrogenase [Rhizoctonia solani]|uniref:Glycerate dehydrogenase n=1 Tax=Rhizoctonia solani TaxID=456999 RepID=A0A0K6G8X3_9AGAM|nr:glycerate dehydrogenase [Rhizoctonia solani]